MPDAEIEQLAERALTLQQPMAGDLRFLLSVLRIVDMALVARFYERMGDHAQPITERLQHLAGSVR